ncbi:hypothetical protein LWI29_023761 [Acer saccharum]|uniref:Aluminum-activated malate transporter n=1 Tax=Acer saccharum TaxID=4024 RepID=A0AA39S002_ACESA|nr:hypothetical protein LWI29_023761 [Acer saccharum]
MKSHAYVESSKNAANDLKIALESASLNNADMQAIMSSATVASILIEVVSCVEKISEAVHELSNLAQFNKIKEAMSVSPKLEVFEGRVFDSRPLYGGFGVSGMWAVLTVVVVFEFTVGQTVSRGLNNSFATLLACVLGIGANHLASLSGEKGEPIILGILVFLLAAASSFIRFFPKIKARFDYGILILILTFSMVSVSGSREEDLLEMSYKRLSTILVGVAICVIVSIFVCPVWAGQDLHQLVASNIEKLAGYLEEFGGEYFQRCSESEESGGGGVSKKDKPFLQGYKIVLNSKNTEESLANFARSEPPHGRFWFRHPWKQCLKIGDLARECAYKIESLNAYIGPDIRVSPEFNGTIQDACMKMSSGSGKALKALASAIKNMSDSTFSSANAYVESSKNAANDLKIALESASLNNADMQAIMSSATVASILIEVVSCVEKISEAVHELSNLAQFNKIKEAMSFSPELNQPHNLLHTALSVEPVLDGDDSNHVVTIHETADSLENENPNGQNPTGEQPLG